MDGVVRKATTDDFASTRALKSMGAPESVIQAQMQREIALIQRKKRQITGLTTNETKTGNVNFVSQQGKSFNNCLGEAGLVVKETKNFVSKN